MAWPNRQTRTSTAEHKAWAREVMRRCRRQCQILLPGCTGRAQHADHIVPVAEGGAEFDVANGQGACESCHEKKTKDEAARGRSRSYGRGRHPVERHPSPPAARERLKGGRGPSPHPGSSLKRAAHRAGSNAHAPVFPAPRGPRDQ